jgi:acetyl-CoA decarbonylase/synthase complex subunit gamma
MPGYYNGEISTTIGAFPRVSTDWSMRDRLNTIRVRWSVGRMNYRVNPGVYAVGNPGKNSRVFVTGNYKLSFDHLRRALDGIDAWILVIDTRGINVWCAAGKGTFSTKEVVRRIRIHHLEKIVDHRKIILPQLSAIGVAAHEVKRMTGFTVIYGPVRADDLKSFIERGLKADDAMRRVTFPFRERIKLIPVDIFYGKYYLAIVPLFFLLISGFTAAGYSMELMTGEGWKPVVDLYAGYLTGCVIVPAALPLIPFRRFALKGLAAGWITATALHLLNMLGTGLAEIITWFLMIGGISSFMAMNFTGSSTFTSLSGVQKEMKTALPVQIAMVAAGLAGWIFTRFYNP